MGVLKTLEHWVGPKKQFSGEQRLLHSALLLAMVTLTLGLFWNTYQIESHWKYSLPGGFILYFALLFTLGRKGMVPFFVLHSFTIGCLGYLGVNWFLMGGIDGPTGYFLIVVGLFCLLMYPYRLRWLLLSLFLAYFTLLYYLQFEYNHLVLPYQSVSLQREDLFFFFLLAFWAMAVLIMLNRKHDMEQKKQIQQAARVRSRFLSSLNKEVIGPMEGILNLTQMSIPRTLNTEVQGYLESIDVSGKHVLNVLSDMQELSEMVNPRLELNNHSFDLQLLCQELISFYSNQSDPRHLNWQLDYDPNLPRYIFSDSRRLKQILFHLIGNAWKYTPTGSVFLRIHRSGNFDEKLYLEVRDTGVGMSQVLMEHFLSSAPNRMQGIEGGMGLRLCRHLVGQLGGTLSAYNHPEGGCVFHFDLPLEERAEEEQLTLNDHNTSAVLPKGVRVMVADANHHNARTLKVLLEKSGAEVNVVRSGLEWMHSLEGFAPDLVLLDLEMENNNSLELVKQVRAGQVGALGQRVPIVGLVKKNTPTLKVECTLAGINDLLVKPFDVDRLLFQIQKFA